MPEWRAVSATMVTLVAPRAGVPKKSLVSRRSLVLSPALALVPLTVERETSGFSADRPTGLVACTAMKAINNGRVLDHGRSQDRKTKDGI